MNRRALTSVALLLLLACRKDTAKQADASPPPERVAVVDPEEEKSPLANMRVNEVKFAYDQLRAGKTDDTIATLKKLGSPRPVNPREIASLITTSDTGRVLLDSIRPCERERLSEVACERYRDRTRGGTCKGKTLTSACATTVHDVETGAVLGAYAPFEIAARGKWIVDLSDHQSGKVLDRDLNLLAQGSLAYDFVPLDESHLLQETATDDARSVKVLDLGTRTSSNGCLLAARKPTSQPIHSAGLAADGTTLVYQLSPKDGSRVYLCEVSSGKILGDWGARGEKSWAVSTDGKTLYVSGILIASPTVGHPSNDYEAVAEVEHLAINATTGAITARARTEERLRARNVALVPNANVLVIAQSLDVTMLGTKPFASPPGPPPKAGFAPGPGPAQVSEAAPEIQVFSNATFLVVDGFVLPGMTNHAASAWRRARRHMRLFSAKTRAVLWQGTVERVFEDREGKRAGWIAMPEKPGADPNAVVVDATGKVTTRALPPDFDAGFPPELAGMVDTSRAAPLEIAEKLAPNLCAIGGLFVPRKLCSL